MKSEAPTSDERLVVDGTEFQFDKDGDLQIDITDALGIERWTGVFLSHENAVKLRDFLQRKLP